MSASELVIFVHGTGAGDDADRGVRWWQRSSVFERKFSATVSPHIAVDRPFHWSGANSERVRHRSAEKLTLAARAPQHEVVVFQQAKTSS